VEASGDLPGYFVEAAEAGGLTLGLAASDGDSVAALRHAISAVRRVYGIPGIHQLAHAEQANLRAAMPLMMRRSSAVAGFRLSGPRRAHVHAAVSTAARSKSAVFVRVLV
jgi:hypothetical protein